MKTKIQIKSIFGKLLFEFEKENNCIKDTMKEAKNRGAYLREADLREADLWEADLQGANLQGAYLQGADLQGADLRGAYLQGADLQGADLRGAYLQGAYLQGADLQGADLRGAYLQEAYLQKIYSQNTILPEGELIVWKKLQNDCITKLLIPKEAKRVNAIGSRKCRFEFAKVIEIKDSKSRKVKKGIGQYNSNTIYKVGEFVYPDSFDFSPLIECSNGIHAFITIEEAKNY